MKHTLLTTVAIAVLSSTIFTTNLIAEEKKMNLSLKEKAVTLLNSIETGDTSAIAYVNANNYTQHNQVIADGLVGFGEVLKALPKGSAKVSIKRAFQDGNYVFTHTDYNFFGPKVGFDLFRFEDGLIVEHWDNLTEKSDKPNPSNHTQLDGPTDATDITRTKENKALIKDFVETILVKGELNKLVGFFDGDNYIQHNTAIADKVSGLGKALEELAAAGITMVYEKNYTILGEGNFVLSISGGSFAGKPVSFYDLFRVENGKIAEHWDIIENLLPKDQWKNDNGKFGNL